MNKDNNTLVILTPGFPQSEADTNCLPMQQDFVRTLKEAHPDLNIIILSFQYPYFKETYRWHDTTVISFDGKNKGGLARLLLRQKVFTTLKRINSSNNIIGVLSFWYNECAWVGKKFADRNKLKHFCWLLGQDAKKENKYPGRLRPNAGELIALSDFLQDEFEKNHRIRPAFVIPPGVDNKQPGDLVKERNIDIIATGSLIPLKQYELFISVIAEIKKQIPAVKAMLIGDGVEKNRLQNLVSAYGLEQNITLAGELAHPEVLQYMQRAKVFLHPSSYEGFGVVCIEALLAGCQVISFCKPMKQEIEHWHIAADKEDMIQKAIELLQDPDPVYKSIVPFTINDTAKKMMALFAY